MPQSFFIKIETHFQNCNPYLQNSDAVTDLGLALCVWTTLYKRLQKNVPCKPSVIKGLDPKYHTIQ